MPPFSPRALLTCSLLTGAVAGCAHAGATPVDRGADRGSIVTSEDLERTPGATFETALMAKVPGIWVTRTSGGGLAIRIRGLNSIYGSNYPLYVIDGTAVEAGPEGAVPNINPFDIAFIQVLKDAGSTGMYGMRGANGVIIIKTKQAFQ